MKDYEIFREPVVRHLVVSRFKLSNLYKVLDVMKMKLSNKIIRDIEIKELEGN